MTLRTRLLLAAVATFVVFVGGSVVVLANQERSLLHQIDDLLTATPAPRVSSQQPTRPVDATAAASDPLAPDPLNADGPPISDLYIGVVATDGTVETVVAGQRLTDLPQVDDLIAAPPATRTFLNVDGVDNTSEFRVLYTPAAGGRAATIIAMPTDNLRSTIDRLRVTFALIAAGLATVMAVAGFWMNRYGLRPITKMTETADAITGGDRTRRADTSGSSTEVDKMANALNLMLDERDADEDRMRAFVSDASHELRTPLTSISGYLDLYQEGGFRQPGQLDDAVRRMRLEASRMNLLVDDLLLLSKLDEQQPLTTEPVDISLLLGDVAASAVARQPDRSIEVSVPGATLVVEADRLRLHQAISVLVDNALGHTPPDARIEIAARRDGDTIELSVADEGPGLSEHDRTRIFDRFYRGDSSRARSSGGSGLGLSVAASIIEAHHGTLDVTSQLGDGATFTARLPTGS